MGKQWKKGSKLANSSKKSKLFHRLAKEIQVAARLGGNKPENNPRLKLAIENALSQNLTKDTIQRALERAESKNSENFEEILYEAIGAQGLGIIIEVQTDNKVRTVSEIRLILKKNQARMGESGSVLWMFDRVASIQAKKSSVKDIEEEALEAGADDVETDDDGLYIFYTQVKDMESLKEKLKSMSFEIISSALIYKNKDQTEISDPQTQEQVVQLLESLEDHDDVKNIFSTF